VTRGSFLRILPSDINEGVAMEAKLEQPVTSPTGTAIKFVIGTFLTLIGILLTLQNLDLLNALPVLRYWPLVLVVIGLLKFVARSGSVFGIVLMIAGAWMTAFNLDWILSRSGYARLRELL
jgi:hypothetical protein